MRYLIAMLVVSSALGNTDTMKHDTLGKGFYLPKRNIIEDAFIGGASIFEDSLPEECLVQTKPGSAGKTSSNMVYYEDTKSFYQQFGASLGLSGALSSAFMLDGALTYVSGEESKSSVTGISLTVKSTKSAEALSQDCINKQPLSRSLLEDFDHLPEISYPKAYSSWAPYGHFLEKYGSHVSTEIVHGSQLVQWEFSKTSSKLSKRELEAKACLDLLSAAPKIEAQLKANACAKFSSKELNSAKKVNTKEKVTVNGGSVDTQGKMRTAKSRTDELIIQLIKEGQGDFAVPIGYRWKALYNIILQRYSDVDRNVRARNLQIYFEGMKNYGCRPVEESGTVLREFVVIQRSGNQDEYVCRVKGEGCRVDSDCRVKLPSLGCYCYGKTCIDKVTANVGGVPKEERVIRKHKKGKYNEGVNKSCKAGLFSKCKCLVERLAPEWVNVWSSESGTKKVNARSAFIEPKRLRNCTRKAWKKRDPSLHLQN